MAILSPGERHTVHRSRELNLVEIISSVSSLVTFGEGSRSLSQINFPVTLPHQSSFMDPDDEEIGQPVAFPAVPAINQCIIREYQRIEVQPGHIIQASVLLSTSGSYYEIGRVLRECIYGQVNHAIEVRRREDGTYFRPPNPRELAIKTIRRDRLMDGRLRFENPMAEIAAMNFIGDHPNVSSCVEITQDENGIYIIMNFYDIGDLCDIVIGAGRLREDRARRFFRAVLTGLQHIHRAGVAHRDMSLENVMCTGAGAGERAVIIDFGMSVRLPLVEEEPMAAGGGGKVRKIPPQGQMGKKNYMSPEVLANLDPLDPQKSDIWALGPMLFIMLTGAPPVERASLLKPHYRLVVAGRWRDLVAELGVRISDDALDLVQRIMRVDPDDRLTIEQILNHPWMQEIGQPLAFPVHVNNQCTLQQWNLEVRPGHAVEATILQSSSGSFYALGRVLRNSIYGQVNHAVEVRRREDGTYFRPTYQRQFAIEARRLSDPNVRAEIAAMNFIGEHQHVSSFVESAEDHRGIYIIRNLYDAGDRLDSIILRERPLPEDRARRIFRAVLTGLQHIHRAGVAHRDMSLENVMCTGAGAVERAVIIGLNLCVRLPLVGGGAAAVGSNRVRRIPPQGQKGKVYCMAPEVVMDEYSLDPQKSDIWALGPILFIMITGRPPVREASIADVNYRLVAAGRLRDFVEDWGLTISPEAVDLVQRIMRANPDDRLTIKQILNHPWMQEVGQPLAFPAHVNNQCTLHQRNLEVRPGHAVEATILQSSSGSFYELGRVLRNCINGQVNHAVEVRRRGDGTYFRPQNPRQFVITTTDRNEHPESQILTIAAMNFIGEHPNVSSFVESTEDPRGIYTIMNFCDGGDLLDLVAEAGPLPEDRVRRVFRDVLTGLQHIHRAGVAHRDMSLENVMLSGVGAGERAVIIGLTLCVRLPLVEEPIAAPVGGGGAAAAGSNRVRRIPPQGRKGKVYYMAPEVLANLDPLDPQKSNIWALGPMLFIMLTGAPPVERASITDYNFRRIADGRLHELVAHWGLTVSEEAVDLVQRIMRVDPDDRLTIEQILNHPWMQEPNQPQQQLRHQQLQQQQEERQQEQLQQQLQQLQLGDEEDNNDNEEENDYDPQQESKSF